MKKSKKETENFKCTYLLNRLIKKNRKRIIDSSKPSRERIRSRNGILTESKFHSNASYM